MKFRLALEESKREHDRTLEVRGLTFVIDPFAASFIEEITVDYDEFDEFVVRNEVGPQSTC